MKKSLVILPVFLLLTLSLICAASIDTKEEYKTGETMIAKVLASFPQGLEKQNVNFYRDGYVEVEFNYDVGKIGDYYYITASLEGKNPNNYTLKIEDTNYYKAGQVVSDDITSEFVINSEVASFFVDPGFIFETSNFIIDVKSLSDLTISVSISPPSEISAVSSVSLSPGQTKSVAFSFDPPSSDIVDILGFSSGGTSYNLPIHLLSQNENPECGNNQIDLGESCDGNNWGDVDDCTDYGFDDGTLACRAPNTYKECTFDTSGCFNESSTTEPECGNNLLESGEQCDGDEWGKVRSCTYFGFDAGTLRCIDCSFDTDDCYNNVECNEDRDCKDGYECVDDLCEKRSDYCDQTSDCFDDEICDRHVCKYVECKLDSECGANQECTQDYKCIDKKKECVNDSYCRSIDTCVDGFCVPKNRECTKDSECDDNQECNSSYMCVDKTSEDKCSKDSDCGDSEECVGGNCVDVQAERLCANLGGVICATDKICEGDYQEFNSRVCCMQPCTEKPKSSTGKIIGWSALIIIVVGLVFFYFKVKKTKSKNPDLRKIATAPRVKDSLLR